MKTKKLGTNGNIHGQNTHLASEKMFNMYLLKFYSRSKFRKIFHLQLRRCLNWKQIVDVCVSCHNSVVNFDKLNVFPLIIVALLQIMNAFIVIADLNSVARSSAIQ